MIKRTLFAAAAAAPLLLALPASAATIVNGSFEDHTCAGAAGSFATIFPGNACITGWDVGPHSVDLVGAYWQAHDGIMSVDLGGNAPGSISQTFATVVGGVYTVNYWLSGNPDGGDLAKFGLISAINGTTVASSTFLGIQGSSHANMNYLPWQFTFTALEASTTLTFAADTSEGAYGPVLDAVSITTAVPEPGTWAMMLLGFGLIGFGLRKRKANDGMARMRVSFDEAPRLA